MYKKFSLEEIEKIKTLQLQYMCKFLYKYWHILYVFCPVDSIKFI